MLADVAELPHQPTQVLDAQIRLLHVDTLIWLGDPRAAAAARTLAQWANERGLTRVELESWHRVLVLQHGSDHTLDPVALTRLSQSQVRSPRAAALLGHARALDRGDDDLIEIAERELNRCGLWLPPGEQALSLTYREREVAALARARLSSRTIATRLGVSARTVDSHLASAFTKLGVRSREDLSHALA